MRLPHRSPLLRTGALAIGALLLLSACKYEEVDGVGTRTMDVEHPPQSDVVLDGCHRDELGRWHADVTVTNNTPAVQTYELTIGFYDGDTRLAQRAHWIRALRVDEVAEPDPAWWVESGERVTDCRLLTVNRFA
ncbi:MAG: hypothetical protein R8F63_03300 [Acidimicrobiales bacterium]|nr:hypothetical protein [Acidimicrobiales bacterium]